MGRKKIKQQHKGLNSDFKKDLDRGIIKYVGENQNVFSRS